MMQTLSWGLHLQMSQKLLYNGKPPKAAGDRIGWHEGAHYVGHADRQQLLIGINSVVILTGWEEKKIQFVLLFVLTYLYLI